MTQITLTPTALDQERRNRIQADRAKARRDLRAWGWWVLVVDGEEVG